MGFDALAHHLWYATHLPVPAMLRSLLYHLLGTARPLDTVQFRIARILHLFLLGALTGQVL